MVYIIVTAVNGCGSEFGPSRKIDVVAAAVDEQCAAGAGQTQAEAGPIEVTARGEGCNILRGKAQFQAAHASRKFHRLDVADPEFLCISPGIETHSQILMTADSQIVLPVPDHRVEAAAAIELGATGIAQNVHLRPGQLEAIVARSAPQLKPRIPQMPSPFQVSRTWMTSFPSPPSI